MPKFIEIVTLILANVEPILGGIDLILLGLIAICLVIPGPQPEATLQKVLDFLGKFSRKKPEQK